MVASKANLAIGLATMPLMAEASRGMPFLRMKDLQGIENPESAKWTPISKDVEFLPVDNLPGSVKKPSGKLDRKLEQDGYDYIEDGYGDTTDSDSAGAFDEYNPYSVQPFVEGMSEYDEYQQAWRMLGFMIDCNTPADDDEDGDHHSQDTTDEGCARYVLWAAYVDLEYEGAGIAEYQFYNKTKGKWDATACNYADDGGSRCAKMDCHEEDTHFSLLGFFKHRNYGDWMEQLFKHEGICVWSDEQYAFMKNARKAWPEGCVDSGVTSDEGDVLYYDVKPMSQGRIGVALYVDSRCTVEYSSDTDVVENFLGNFFQNGGGSHDSGDNNYDFSGESLSESMDRWNDAFDVWQICHPCVAYDIENTDGTKYIQDNYYYYNGQYYYYGGNRDRDLGGEYNAEGDRFECYDDAGYTNVNQCMKFSAKTVMKTATFRDMSLGRAQGTLAKSPLAGYLHTKGMYREKMMGNFFTYFFFASATLFLVYALVSFYRVKIDTKYEFNTSTNESLLVDKGEFN